MTADLRASERQVNERLFGAAFIQSLEPTSGTEPGVARFAGRKHRGCPSLRVHSLGIVH